MDSTQKAVKNQEICEPLQGNLGITQSSGLESPAVPHFKSMTGPTGTAALTGSAHWRILVCMARLFCF